MGDDNEVNGDLNANSMSQSTGDPQLDKAVRQWLKWDKNCCTRAQVESLVAAGQVNDLRSRLSSRMTFGTAGLRAPMGAGFNRINDLTIIQSTQGLCSYLSRCFANLSSRGVVVGFDTRGQESSGCSSQRLAKLTAAVILNRDIPVHLFSTFVPTPFVPYAVKKLGAAAGVMITASHNPKEDNGYKVYWCNGAQISSPHDKEILRSIEEQLEPWCASCWDLELVERCSMRTDPLTLINSSYMDELASLCFHRDLNSCCPLKFVHSSFHGVGHDFIQQAFQTFGFAPPIPVPEQKDPDPNFPTVRCPNPEEGESVLELSLLLAEKENARIVLATDPDADRLAVAEKSDGCRWKVFTGNELAALLGWWMFFNWKENHPDPADSQRVYMLATTVSSKILQAFALIEGFHFEETLPGFKYIGNRIHELAKTGNTVIFSFEESIGFLCGGMAPDKDGISTAVVVAEMASYLHNRSLSLTKQLDNIYQTYGYHLSKTSYVICKDPPTIQKIFSRIRNFDGEGSYPKTCGGVQIVHVRDITTGYDSSKADLRSVFPVSRSSHMITFTLQNGIVATLRTSGTEPKIKYYSEFCAAPGKRDVSSLEEELKKVTDALLDDFLEPEKNNLTRCFV
ncbi:glucose 1,6-bisphosphate synthase [Solea senegalensis]|uniref:Glucose 1,6-bisphosphate synthase n=1 Tax=Solea senegalensis TaxID=28829 RepID=A0AAV6PGY7_SOLSE|nr:glucose 1,6-bisphosphate synthase [Solea senegalensis]KAG7464250.1 glucose 1,6-bisphosphate synthase [Solea senegalensis]